MDIVSDAIRNLRKCGVSSSELAKILSEIFNRQELNNLISELKSLSIKKITLEDLEQFASEAIEID